MTKLHKSLNILEMNELDNLLADDTISQHIRESFTNIPLGFENT